MYQHELRQPLSAIAIETEQLKMLISQTPIDLKKSYQSIERIKSYVRRSSEILKMLTHREKNLFHKELVNVGDFLQGVIDRTRFYYDEKYISFSYLKPAVEEFLLINPIAIEQVLINLFENSSREVKRKNPLKGEIRVVVTRENGFVTIRVTDSARDYLRLNSSIFDAEEDENFQSGLGLGFCNQILEEHGGSVLIWHLGEVRVTDLIFQATLPPEKTTI